MASANAERASAQRFARSIPVRTFADWRDPPPGFFEVDMVEHCGGAKIDGDFVHSLVLTDIASGWTECIAMPVRDQSLVVEALSVAAGDLPFPMLGVDTDNDSAFHEPDRLRLLPGSQARADSLASLQEERPGLGRAKERRRRPSRSS